MVYEILTNFNILRKSYLILQIHPHKYPYGSPKRNKCCFVQEFTNQSLLNILNYFMILVYLSLAKYMHLALCVYSPDTHLLISIFFSKYMYSNVNLLHLHPFI